MKTFEEKLARLEELSDEIRRSDIGIEDALKTYEEGIKLTKILEKELAAIEGKIQILTNSPLDEKEQEPPQKKKEDESALELDLFAPELDSPAEGLRK